MAVLDTLCIAARIKSQAMSEPSTPRYSLMAALSSGVALQPFSQDEDHFQDDHFQGARRVQFLVHVNHMLLGVSNAHPGPLPLILLRSAGLHSGQSQWRQGQGLPFHMVQMDLSCRADASMLTGCASALLRSGMQARGAGRQGSEVQIDETWAHAKYFGMCLARNSMARSNDETWATCQNVTV
eukprot:1154178-Pelagomonas_calceolata.AAC.2